MSFQIPDCLMAPAIEDSMGAARGEARTSPFPGALATLCHAKARDAVFILRRVIR